MTGRLPFKAGDLRKNKPATPKSEATLTVSALAGLIDGAIQDGTPAKVRVVGEISGFRDRTHWYFDMKDADAVVQCVIFASSARKLGFTPENGQEVVASGRIEYYAKSGKVSLIATRLEPVGTGALDLAYQRLVEELRELGWFAPERKRLLPMFPNRIAVLTSRSSAAYQDVLDTARRRCSAVEILLVDVRVQGEAAADEIAQAIRVVGDMHKNLGVEAIVLTRGGGSKEDLWSFNERVVAAAIVDSPIPVVAAIGHESDTTIAELVADVRGATPTQAVMRLVPDSEALLEQISRQANRLERSIELTVEHAEAASSSLKRGLWHSMRNRMNRGTIGLERVAGQLEKLRPDRVASRREQVRAAALAAAEQRLLWAMQRKLDKRRYRLGAAHRELAAVSPLAVMARGYSITLDSTGRAVRSISDLAKGDQIETRLADGSIRSVVGTSDPKRRPKRRNKTERADKRDQMDLFDDKR